MNVSRRKLVQVLTAAAAAVPLANPTEAQAPAAPNADTELEGARRYLSVGAQIVRQVPLAVSVEPALRFIPRS